jgi:nucleoside-diphosphate-sugar epimerase
MPKVLVTGATGLLGANTVQELLTKGYEVKVLVRDRKKYLLPDHRNAEIIEGDLADPVAREKAVTGCSIVIHTAAETGQSKIRYSDYHKTNVELTEMLYESAVKHGVKRIIHVSTGNVFGYGDMHHLGDENTPTKAPFSDSLYVQSKIASQELALSFSDRAEIVVVNPTFLIGSFDQRPSSGRVILHGYGKKVIFYPPGGKNFVDAKDAAGAIIAAIQHGKNKEAYILSGENLSYKQFFKKLADHSSSKPLLIKIPASLLFIIGIFGNLMRKMGIENEFTLTNMRILCVKNFYSNSKSRAELRVEFGAIDSAIHDAVSWFKGKGKLRG